MISLRKRLFPNPTEDYFNISTEEDGIHTIKAFGIDGTLLIHDQFESRMSVDISSWSSGTYTISLIAPSGEFNTTKLIKL